MRHLIVACLAPLRALARRRDGNLSMLFGLTAIPLVIAAGLAVDATRAYTVKTRLGAALDAAALAVGSEVNQTPAQLATDLQNYFKANYPSSAIGTNVTVTPVPANVSLTASTINFQAQATVPMTFMRIAGFNSITVSVSSQIKRTAGLEVAIVLDNTGSMLCGPNDGAPNYTDSACAGGVVSGDTNCTNGSNQSRICVLRNAATQFVNTLTSAITASGQLYISVVPYVTTVNVGPALCTGATTCSHIAMSAGKFTDDRGAVINDNLGHPITYDTTQNPLTTEWLGCVVEPTSSDENSGVGGVLDSAVADPDVSEPAGGWPAWYAYYWKPDGYNSWNGGSAPSYSIKSQDPTSGNDVQGKVVTDWGKATGPNLGCPVPLLPLTDATTAAGQTTILNTINSMWPRDAGGTQVHIGMIWGWRTLSPVGPFPANNSHPLDYATMNTTGWKKVVVLMTDGTEEWPDQRHLTGLGFLSDGKINTSSSTSTAQSNLDTRLQTVCSNMAASNDFIIYTIGLGSDGASNTTLQNCATTGNGGFFEAASTGNLQQVFQDVAQSLLALRLTQ